MECEAKCTLALLRQLDRQVSNTRSIWIAAARTPFSLSSWQGAFPALPLVPGRRQGRVRGRSMRRATQHNPRRRLLPHCLSLRQTLTPTASPRPEKARRRRRREPLRAVDRWEMKLSRRLLLIRSCTMAPRRVVALQVETRRRPSLVASIPLRRGRPRAANPTTLHIRQLQSR